MFTQENLKLAANILVIVGAINWLGIGLQNTNYVSKFTGTNSGSVYILVGVAGVYLAYLMFEEYNKKKLIQV